MGKEVVTEAGTLEFYVSVAGDGMITNPSFQIITQPDSKVSIDGNKVYAGTFQVILQSSQFNGMNQTAPVTFTISPQCQSKTPLGALLLVGIESTPMPVVYQQGTSVTTATVKCSFTNAGQTAVTDQ